jgi:hypothetical protein
MKTKQNPMKRPTLRKLSRKRYRKNIESARKLSESIEAKAMGGLSFLFPHYIYKQLIKFNR